MATIVFISIGLEVGWSLAKPTGSTFGAGTGSALTRGGSFHG
jgi:hypothetical protein